MTDSSVENKLADSIRDHMTVDVACLRENQTVGEALEALRAKPTEARILYLYVVDEKRRLRGVVPTRRLLFSSPDTAICDIMVREIIAIPERATVLDACEFFMLHRLLAFPVVDPQQRLIGMVDVALYTEELQDLDRRETHDELFQLIGVHWTDARHSSPVQAFANRFPWLMANICGGILAAFLTGIFEAELQKAVALALFIPVVLALSESVSIQSVSLTLQAARGNSAAISHWQAKLLRELAAGLLLGAACAVIVVTVEWLWLGDVRVAACLAGGIAGGVACAAVTGVAVPHLLRHFRCEPQVAAGPIALAVADMLTLLIYFSIARSLI